MAKENNQAERKPHPFQLLDGSVTTYGFRVLVDGVDTSQFERNPIMFYRHNDYELPIGTWSNIRKENGKLLADANFDYDDPDQEVQRIIGKVERGILKMGSVGLVDNEWSDDSIYQIEGQTLPTLVKSRLREASIVPIGGNHNSMKLYDNVGTVVDLSDEIKLSDFIKPNKQKSKMNKNLLTALKLSDDATPEQIETAVNLLLSDNKTLKEANATLLTDKETLQTEKDNLQAKVDAIALKDKEEKQALFDTELQAAFKDGRLDNDKDGKTKKDWQKLFDLDQETTMSNLKTLPKRQPISQKLGDDNTVEGNAFAERQKEIEERKKSRGK